MPIKLHCPSCSMPLSVPEKLAGTTGICPGCRKAVPIPAVTPVEATLVEATLVEPINRADQCPVTPPVQQLPATAWEGLTASPTIQTTTATDTGASKQTSKPRVRNTGLYAGLCAIFAGLTALIADFLKVWNSQPVREGRTAIRGGKAVVKRVSDEWDFFGPLFTILFWIAVIAGIIWLLVWVVRKLSEAADSPRVASPPPQPLIVRPGTDPIDSAATHWWILLANQPTGPYATVSISEGLRTGTFRPDTMACPVGGRDWLPILCWSTFVQSGAATTNLAPAKTLSIFDP